MKINNNCNFFGSDAKFEHIGIAIKKIDSISNDLDKINDKSIVFKVQIKTSKHSISNSLLNLGLEVEEQRENNIFRYFIGETTNKSIADNLKKTIIEKGFSDAFIVAFSGGIQISVKEALNLQKINNDE